MFSRKCLKSNSVHSRRLHFPVKNSFESFNTNQVIVHLRKLDNKQAKKKVLLIHNHVLFTQVAFFGQYFLAGVTMSRTEVNSKLPKICRFMSKQQNFDFLYSWFCILMT